MGGTSLSSLISHFTDSIDSSLPSSFRPKLLSTPSNCYKFFVKIQDYHILLRHRHVESHLHDILLLSLRAPFFVASLSAQITWNSQILTHARNFVCYIGNFSTNFGLLNCAPLVGKSLVRGVNDGINEHCVKFSNNVEWRAVPLTISSRDKVPLTSLLHPMVSAGCNSSYEVFNRLPRRFGGAWDQPLIFTYCLVAQSALEIIMRLRARPRIKNEII